MSHRHESEDPVLGLALSSPHFDTALFPSYLEKRLSFRRSTSIARVTFYCRKMWPGARKSHDGTPSPKKGWPVGEYRKRVELMPLFSLCLWTPLLHEAATWFFSFRFLPPPASEAFFPCVPGFKHFLEFAGVVPKASPRFSSGPNLLGPQSFLHRKGPVLGRSAAPVTLPLLLVFPAKSLNPRSVFQFILSHVHPNWINPSVECWSPLAALLVVHANQTFLMPFCNGPSSCGY